MKLCVRQTKRKMKCESFGNSCRSLILLCSAHFSVQHAVTKCLVNELIVTFMSAGVNEHTRSIRALPCPEYLFNIRGYQCKNIRR